MSASSQAINTTIPPGSIPIIDGHNDTLLSLARTGRSFFDRTDEGHIDLPRAREGGLAGGFFAVWLPDSETAPPPGEPLAPALVTQREADLATVPPMMELAYAQGAAMAAMARFFQLEREAAGAARVVRTVAELRECIATGVFALELHIEGAEPIDPGLDALEVFYQAGVRSLGIVWSRSNAFGHGVTTQFPGSPDTGKGLSEAGKALVRACNRLGIMLDLSHLNEAGFWEVAKLSDAPLVATHSNAHALSPSPRNLTDKQLDAIRDSEGMVGVNFHVGFLRPDGERNVETPLTVMADHVDYLVNRLGLDKVGFGSDFDGATMPSTLSSCAELPALLDVLRERGYDDSALRLLGNENWLRVLGRTWRA